MPIWNQKGVYLGNRETYVNLVTTNLVLNLDSGNKQSFSVYNTNFTGNTWYDLSGNGINGTFNREVTFFTDANTRSYFSFDGANSNIDCGTSASLYSSGPTSQTIEAVIYPITGGENNFGRIVDRSAASTVGYVLLLDTTGSSGINAFRYVTYPSGELRVDNQLSLNTWQHVVATQSGTTAVLYKNGTQIGTISTMSNPPAAGTANFYIGNRAALDRTFNGRIALIRYYNRALTQDEVTQNFNAIRGRYGI